MVQPNGEIKVMLVTQTELVSTRTEIVTDKSSKGENRRIESEFREIRK